MMRASQRLAPSQGVPLRAREAACTWSTVRRLSEDGMSSLDRGRAMVQRAPGGRGRAPLAESCASLQEPCFDLCGRRSRVRRRLQAAPGTTSARRGVVWVYDVVAHPGGVLPACGKGPRGAVTGVGRTPFPTQPPRPYHFVWLTTGRTVRIECLVHLSTNLTEGRLRFLLGIP